MYQKNKDVIIGIILSVLSCIYLALSFQIKRSNIDRIVGSRMFPQICGTLVLLLSVWLIFSGLRNVGQTEEIREKRGFFRTAIVLGSYAAYIFVMDKIGFTGASVLYLFSQMAVMGKPSPGKKTLMLYFVISVAVSLGIYLLFNQVFMLMLPKAGWF